MAKRCPFCDGDGGAHSGPHLFSTPGTLAAVYTHPALSFAVMASPLGAWIATHRPTMASAEESAAVRELLALAWDQVEHLRKAPAASAEVLRNATWGKAQLHDRGAR